MSAQGGSLSTYFEHSPDFLFVTDLDGSLLRTSRCLEEELGLTAPASFGELVHPADRDSLSGWSRLREGQPDVLFECRLRVKGGLYRHFTVSARRVPEANEVCGSLRGAATVDAGVVHSHKIFRAILDNLPIMVGVVDPNGVLLLGEGKGLEAVGVKPGQLVGMNVLEVYADAPEVVANYQRAIRGEAFSMDTRFGDQYFTNWYVPVRNERGELESAINVTLDITESKRVEKELLAQIELIEGQKQVIRSLATPIIQVWDGVLTMPLVGVVDSMRAADVMNSLLLEVVRTRARFALLDVTGVEVMDTATAGHILRLIQALRLLGAEGIVTGVRPVIAQTMVGIGVDMANIVTLRSLREGLQYCIRSIASEAREKAQDA
ncbi:MAG TPA: PAS domain S-box protein [Polyangiaceae bacterium]|nr:PAS domain S-box protein [Polyangiaceae bacterium]